MIKKRKVNFRATRVKKVPVKVKFRTYDGKVVSFRATKAVKVPRKVTFYAKRKKRK